MVFRSFSPDRERPETESSSPALMATAPVKSQPLHNFSLPYLKWGKNQTSNQRCRKPNESSRDSPSIDHRASASEAESDGDGGSSQKDQEIVNQKNCLGSKSAHNNKNRFLVSSCSSGTSAFAVKTETRVDEARSSNLVIRIPKGSGKEESGLKNKSGSGGEGEAEGGCGDGGETEEPVTKPWNLRPRRSLMKTNNNETGGGGSGGGTTRNGGGMEEKQEIQPKSLRLRGLIETDNVEKKDKIDFSNSLSREEIEEDFFAWTGSKPSRRPKKRNRTVQKQLDNLLPGLWLAGISVDSYDVPELPSKHK